jgi:hypothetical protein
MTRSIEVIAWVFGSFLALLALFGAVWLMLNALHKGKGRSLHELRQLADASKLWFLNPLSERTIYLWKWAGLIVLILWFFIASVMQFGKPHGTPQPVSDATQRDGPKKSPTLAKPSNSSRRPNASDPALHSSRFEVPVDVNDATDKLRITSFGNEFEALLKRHGIVLSLHELEKSQSAFMKFRERQVSLEENLAEISYPSPTQCVLSIPPHPQASSELLADLKNEISGLLTETDATAVNSAVEGDLWMGNVLASANQVQITVNGQRPELPTGCVEITRSIKSADNGSTLWSTTSVLTPAMLVNGEYAYLAQYAAVVLHP